MRLPFECPFVCLSNRSASHRLNPDIVGFTIGGEKIVSAHYMDDTTIIIKQSRCFKEMWKTKRNGGCKLINNQVKSETSKAKWLMEIATNPDFRIHLETFSNLVWVQKGDNKGKYLSFMDRNFISRKLKIINPI